MFHLALALGKTVGEIESTMSAIELREWIKLAGTEPVGPLRADYQAGMISAVIASVNSRKRYKPSDFMPFKDMPVDESDPEVAKARQFMREFSKSTSGMRTHTIRPRLV